MSLLNKEETKALLDGIWNNQYDQTKLPYWLFSKIADGLEEATEKGWGSKLGSAAVLKDLQLEESLRKNVYYFAAHKTEKQLAAFNELYRASTNKYGFVKEAVKMNEMWNFHWYNTEYNVTTRLARSGRDWRRIESTKDYYPMLRFVAVQDPNTRASHQELHGIVKPVEDPFWSTYFPPLDWNCRCRTERMQAGAETNIDGKELPKVEKQFSTRVTDSKKIWQESHPYFQNTPKAAQKVIENMVEQKITEKKQKDKPYKLKSEYTLRKELKEKLKDAEVITDFGTYMKPEEYNDIMGGFDIARAYGKINEAIEQTIGESIKSIGVIRGKNEITITVHTKSVDLTRVFKKGKTVEHSLFEIEKIKQGNGTSKQVIKALYDEYKIAGIKRIDLHANFDVGGYAWAKYGFCAEQDEVRKMIGYFKNKKIADKADKIVSAYFSKYPDASEFPMNLLSNVPEMKAEMLNKNWDGSLDLKNKVQTKIFEDYINGK